MTRFESIQGGRPAVLPRREPQTNGEWFQLIVDQLHANNLAIQGGLDEIKLLGMQLRDVEEDIDKNYALLPRMVADHDARIKILERMYWRVTGVLLTVTALIGFIEWALSRAHP